MSKEIELELRIIALEEKVKALETIEGQILHWIKDREEEANPSPSPDS